METSLTHAPRHPQPSTDEGLRRRFESKFRRNKNGCWIWTASLDKDNYGQFRLGNRVVRAHRFAYSLYTGEEVPAGMDVDHVCHIRRCVNPDHLEVVLHAENMERIRAVDDWLTDDDFNRRKTTPDEVLEHVQTIIERSAVERPNLFGNGTSKGYGVRDCGGAPWRDLAVEEGYIAQDKFAFVRLFLDAVAMGVDWKVAADKILGVSPFTVQDWLANPQWREDLDAARKAGRRSRYSSLESRHLDVMERKIDDASFADVSRSLKSLRDSDRPADKSEDSEPARTDAYFTHRVPVPEHPGRTCSTWTIPTPGQTIVIRFPGDLGRTDKETEDAFVDFMWENRHVLERPEDQEGAKRDAIPLPTQPEFRADPDLLDNPAGTAALPPEQGA